MHRTIWKFLHKGYNLLEWVLPSNLREKLCHKILFDNQKFNVMTWRAGFINWQFLGLRSGEHSLCHSSYTEVYGYRGPVVWPWCSCVWMTLPFSQGPNSENTSLYIRYTRLRWTVRLQVGRRTWSPDTSTSRDARLQYDHMTQNIGHNI